MGVNSGYILQAISGWDAVELIFKCVFIGLWQVIQLTARRLWKGHRRKLSEDFPPV